MGTFRYLTPTGAPVPPADPGELVRAFYERIWNAGDLSAVPALLSPDFRFRGSLGNELVGWDAFREYVRSVREPLAGYRCEILECVTDSGRAFAKMRFSGTHVAPFRGFEPTGNPVEWMGAALFHCTDGVISELWVLGDLAGLDALLQRNQHGRTP
ncbi:MAG TPA: ester cyclase [Acidobacteriaceae bacterium]|nr:ester cyclase [Acidobacteriaceae bacterium]